ncbi:YegP family protein [Pseudarthrobacter sp. H2]|uniref:YegP family protein n=1 Tax=Pseudarthrobacter sp. H2 TaxID=3418415 RepID=UPI003CF0A6FD
MTGTFELFVDEDFGYRFRITAPDGTVMALSRSFPDKQAAVSGISAVREYAGMGLITDLCPKPSTRQQESRPAAPGTGQIVRPSPDSHSTARLRSVAARSLNRVA